MPTIIQFDSLPVGGPAMVVGAISSPRTLSRGDLVHALKLDIAEFRLDLTGLVIGWEERARELRDAGTPVLLTLRSPREGGRWPGDETDRMLAYLNALPHATAIDIEIQSDIAETVARASRESGLRTILSHHNFTQTPPLDELRRIVETGFALGADIVKIAALTAEKADIEILSALLRERGPRLLCCVGMGALGPQSRVELALAGSCLTYGFADETNSPGQISSEELLNRLRAAGAR